MPEPSFLDLFFIFLKTGAFTFGGGYAMIPLLQAQIVPTYLEGPEMSNLIALAQMTPGAVGLNTATYVGYSEYSFIGAICCTLALILPCFTVATIVSFFKKAFQDNKYVKNALFGIRAMVVGMPWPATTSVSGGKAARRFSDAFICAMLPPGKSVRPQEPANSVSPVSISRASSK